MQFNILLLVSTMIFLLTTLFSSKCKAQRPELDTSYFELCCQTNALEYEISDHYVYVPNLFTPNSDGENDLFFPFVSSNIDNLRSFKVMLPEYSEFPNRVLFEVESVSLDSFDLIYWDGRNPLDSSKYYGPFDYELLFTLPSGQEVSLSGSACSVDCITDETQAELDLGNCFTPKQFDLEGRRLNRSYQIFDRCLKQE